MPEIRNDRYEPSHEKLWKHGDNGLFEAHIYTQFGLVELFTYPGDTKHDAFTSLTMYFPPHVYFRLIDRHYHPRWARRLAREFACDCYLQNESEP